MSAGLSDIFSMLGIWLGGRKSTSSGNVPALVTESLAALNTSETALRSNAAEVLADLNVSLQETAVLR